MAAFERVALDRFSASEIGPAAEQQRSLLKKGGERMAIEGSREGRAVVSKPKSLQQSVVTSTFTLQTGLLVGNTVLYFGREVLIPIALALLISFLLGPPIVRLQRLGLGKTFTTLLVVGLSFSALMAIAWAGFGYPLM